jgi:hypothetical protein
MGTSFLESITVAELHFCHFGVLLFFAMSKPENPSKKPVQRSSNKREILFIIAIVIDIGYKWV